jgi:signal transduction histidine kinase/phage shock protein PspC (stress-responsive transcriptional regulator)
MSDHIAALPVRRATRSTDERLLGGVAAGVARHLGQPVLWVRAGFVVLATIGGCGVLLYAALWLVLPVEPDYRDYPDAPTGIAAATRSGKRTPRRTPSFDDVGPLVALAAVGLGVALLLRQVGLGANSTLFWPVLLATAGVAVLWRQADEAQRARWTDSSTRLGPLQALLGAGGWAAYVRLFAGLALVTGAIGVFFAQSGRFALLDDVLIAVLLGVVGLGLIAGPWVFRLTNDLTAERRARVRSLVRADLAAHLHDSVLQTLTMIQKRADDPRTVATLARAQERDLRSWLYDDRDRAPDSLATALRATAAEVEDAHGVPVEVVTVGDVSLSSAPSSRLLALTLAAREAVVNAAKHSGADKVDVYAEATRRRVEVFVRDRGAGFDETLIPPDRLGVRGSIIDRMHRHGGSADIRSAAGTGTEVRLTMAVATGDGAGENGG